MWELLYLITWIASDPIRLGLAIAMVVLVVVGMAYLIRGSKL